jgi:DNA-binding winged helix-turn-helix (wHTH) protein
MSIPMTARSALAVQSGGQPDPRFRYLCFGHFQLDSQRELLFKDGAKLRLPGKVYQTLLTLLERPGEVVTREALRERLWPEGTFVNYDANVNTTVNKLRLALGDSSEQPIYIETIPRIGYCFVGAVERRGELQPAAGAASGVNDRMAAAVPRPHEALLVGLASTGWIAAVLLCGVLIGMGIVLLSHPR